MIVSSEIRLPPDRRPAPLTVLKWYETSLRTHGLDVERLPDDQLGFVVPLGADAQTSWGHTLSVVTRGTISVTLTEKGLRVSANVRPRLWVWGVPLLIMTVMWGTFAGVLGSGGIPFLAASAGYCWWTVWGVLKDTNVAIEKSYENQAAAGPHHHSARAD